MNNQLISTGTVHQIPKDLETILVSNKSILEKWNNLTPLARNEWICWVISVKKEDTRKQHLKRMISELKEEKKRPCCWIGCIHRKDKEISKSVRYIINKGK